jgi:hypothetical protein
MGYFMSKEDVVKICHPSTYPTCSGDIREGSMGLRKRNHFGDDFVNNITKSYGHNLLGSFTLSSLGMRVRKVEFNAGRTPLFFEIPKLGPKHPI